jgi:hypothetical protein
MNAEDLASPRLYPLSFDAASERVRFIALTEENYRFESFLDERLLEKFGFGRWTPFDDVRQAVAGTDAECDFIFHIGHVGSTLLSRLLGEDGRVFSLREPAILRTLAVAELSSLDRGVLDDQTRLFLKLWARVWRPGQRTLLKATSFVSETAPRLMTLNSTARAILMYVQPRTHLAAILAGEASRAELAVNAPMRLTRLHRRLGGPIWRLGVLSEGERAAMSWACEVMALDQVAAQFAGRVLWLDFDALLAEPDFWLAAALRRLHGEASGAAVEAILHSEHLRRYAKAPEHVFDTSVRQQALADSSQTHREEIDRGMAWLEGAASAHPPIGEAVRRLTSLAP